MISWIWCEVVVSIVPEMPVGGEMIEGLGIPEISIELATGRLMNEAVLWKEVRKMGRRAKQDVVKPTRHHPFWS